LPGLEGIDLRLTAWGLPPDEADRRLAAAAERLESLADQFRYGRDDDDLAAVVLDEARRRHLRLGVAESCTGGLLGARLTEVPGSSEVFQGGVICYANELKTSLLGVPPDLLERHGAVSESVALALAEGALARLGVDFAVSVTGIAGPGGGSEEKPVGTIWFGLAGGGPPEARRSTFPGSRHEIRARAAQAALFVLLRRIRVALPL
ncbi:MAG TPA: nicotinamide-nucleotide amidohydrolase family protein, partial [Gemmatimonadales bacterium]